MAEELFVAQCNDWVAKIERKFGTTAGKQLENVLLDTFESKEELLDDLEEENWDETNIMDILYSDQSAYKDTDFCKAFYKILKAVVNDQDESISASDTQISPAVIPHQHLSRRALDMLLLFGYCRMELKKVNMNTSIFADNIIELVLYFYHIPIMLNLLSYDITQEDMNETKTLYDAQCPTLSHDSHQKDLWKSLAVSRKNRLPLLPLCIDSFCRDKLNYYNKHEKSLNINKWRLKHQMLKKIAPNSPKYQDMLKSAMETFMLRYCTVLDLPVREKYDDHLESFANFIIQATEFIQTLLNGDRISPPFQIELMIIPNKITNDNDNDNEDDSDIVDSDFDDSDIDSDSDDNKNDDDDEKIMPDIKQQLNENGVKYESESVKGDYCRPRLFHNMFSNLTKNISSKLGKFGMPYKQRLCIVMDRRMKDMEVFMYSPNVEREFPANHLNEWYFESSSRCVVPGVIGSTAVNGVITSKHSKKGAVFCLSFHCEEIDRLRCYLYTRAQFVRFLPEDIYELLPKLFVETERNKKFVEREKNIKTRSKTQRIQLFDKLFDNFRRQTMKKI